MSDCCKRCGDLDRAKFEALSAPERFAEDDDAVCCQCIGRSWGNILDNVYDLRKVPTDALLRALARRMQQ